MNDDPVETIRADCCIVGGGPAGMMLGFLLARAGVEAVVLEKHADFFRDFRGDTIHPSTLEIFHELGLLEDFLKLPHYKAERLRGWVGPEQLTVADFSHLPTRCKFIAFMPQWDFLDFLAERARRLPSFRLHMNAEATDLIFEQGKVVGARARTPSGPLEVRASLTVGADGRHSTVREKAGLTAVNLGAPMDVLWMRLSRRPGDPEESVGRFEAGAIIVLIDRGDYWQCGFIIAKGGYEELQRRGLPAFRAEVARIVPFLANRVEEMASWENVKLLTVAVDRLPQWSQAGLLCIGDAAHAMSPIGGVGVNLAIQDAVAAANILAAPLRAGAPGEERLAAVQRRRAFPTRVTQALQLFLQNRVIQSTLAARAPLRGLPAPLRLLRNCPILRRIPARLIGMGVRPEHVTTPAVCD